MSTASQAPMMDMSEDSTYPRFRWFILVCFIASNIAAVSVMMGPVTIIYRIAEELHADLGTTSMVVMGLVNFVLIFGNIAGGFLIGRVGVTKAWIAGMICGLFGTLLWPIVGHSIYGVAFLRILNGLALAPIAASVASIGATWFKASERATVIGIVSASVGLGSSVGLITIPALLNMTSDWRTAMALLSIPVILALALNLIALFGPKPPVSPVRHEAREGRTSDFKVVWTLTATYAMLGAAFFGSWVARALTELMPNYLGMPAPIGLGLGALAAGAFMSLESYGQTAGGLLSGLLLDKVFRGNLRRALITTSSTTGFLCFLFVFPAISTSSAFVSVLLALVGVFIGMGPPLVFTFLARSYPLEMVGRLGGISQALVAVGGTVGVFVGATALSITGIYTVSIFLLLLMSSVVAICASRMITPRVFEATDQ